MEKLPPLRNIFIDHYFIRFSIKCPEKNGERHKIVKKNPVTGFMIFYIISLNLFKSQVQ